nr:DUF3427 domain-containing protein [Ligilactobacillus acidipiscis]
MFLSREIAISKRPAESFVLQYLINNKTLSDHQIEKFMKSKGIFYDQEILDNISTIFDLSYFMKQNTKKVRLYTSSRK